MMELRIDKENKKCPLCKSRFGMALIEKSKVICFSGACLYTCTLEEWNKKNPDNKFKL